MAKKKGNRINVGLLCTVCNRQNNVTSLNKLVTPKLELSKYCLQCRKHVTHKSRDKLK